MPPKKLHFMQAWHAIAIQFVRPPRDLWWNRFNSHHYW